MGVIIRKWEVYPVDNGTGEEIEDGHPNERFWTGRGAYRARQEFNLMCLFFGWDHHYSARRVG